MSTLRLLVFSDTHLGLDYPVRTDSSPLRRGEDFFRNFITVLDAVRRHRPHVLIHTGDLFTRPRISRTVQNRAYAALLPLLETGIPLVLIHGNHDGLRLPVHPVLKHPRLHYLDRPRSLTLKVGDLNLILAGMPYVRDRLKTTFPAYLKEMDGSPDRGDVRLLLLHQCVEGSSVGPAGFTFTDGANVVQQAQLPATFHLVLCGHIHRHQELVTRQGVPILFPGSTEKTSFSEIAETKGYLTVTVGRSAGEVSWRFHPLPSRPMVRVDLEPDKFTSREARDFLRTAFEQAAEDAYIQIRPGQALLRLGLDPDRIQTWKRPRQLVTVRWRRERLNKSYLE